MICSSKTITTKSCLSASWRQSCFPNLMNYQGIPEVCGICTLPKAYLLTWTYISNANIRLWTPSSESVSSACSFSEKYIRKSGSHKGKRELVNINNSIYCEKHTEKWQEKHRLFKDNWIIGHYWIENRALFTVSHRRALVSEKSDKEEKVDISKNYSSMVCIT